MTPRLLVQTTINILRKNKENLYSFGATINRALGRFLLVFLSSFLLSKYEFGIFNIFLSIYFFSRLFSENSLNLPFIKFATDREYSPSLVSYQIILLKIFYVALVSGAIILFAGFIVKYTGLERKELLYLLPVMLLALTFYMYVGQVLIYQLKMRQLFIYELLNSIIFILILSAAYISFSTFTTERLIGLFTLSMAAAAIAGGLLFRRYIKILPQYCSELIVKIINYSKFTVLSGISSLVILKADVLMLGYFRTPQEVGAYGLALFVNEAVNLVFDSVLRICLPKASALSENLEDGKIQILFRQSVKNIYIGITPIILLIGVAAPACIHWVYKGKYDESIFIIYFFLASSLIKPVGYVAGVILGATGNIRLDNRNCWITALLNVLCNLVMIPKFGITGAAVASTLSFITLTVINYATFKKVVVGGKNPAIQEIGDKPQ